MEMALVISFVLIMPTTAGYYTPPEALVGQTPQQLRYAGGDIAQYAFGGLPEELASTLGIGANTPLENRAYSIVAGAGQPSEYITKTFRSTDPNQSSYDALAQSKTLTSQAYDERERQLAAEEDPLKARYQKIIDDITAAKTKDVTEQGRVLSREYGARGIPLSSGAYEQDLAGKTSGINQFYTSQATEAGFEREDKLRELFNLKNMNPIEKAQALNALDLEIAQMKSEGADKQLQRNLEMYKADLEQKWKQEDLNLRQQEFAYQTREKAPDYQLTEFNKNLYAFDPANKSITELLKGQLGAGDDWG